MRRHGRKGEAGAGYLPVCPLKLGLSAKECMAVEDAPNGVKAAARAGLRVCFIQDQTPADEEVMKDADICIDCLDQLLDFFPL